MFMPSFVEIGRSGSGHGEEGKKCEKITERKIDRLTDRRTDKQQTGDH